MTISSHTRTEQNNIKAIISSSYNKLYSEFSTTELSEVGNYKILDQIGEGSFGKVYLALHKPTHQKVVIKTSSKNDPNIVREVFYHRQFTYPHITKLYEIIVTETKVWMVLEYCPNKELYDHLLKLKRIPNGECTKLFTQIVGAVYYAHSLNCVHRDLKLENILLDKNGNAKLTDFGFTRESIQKTNLETICGTTVYMSPELTERKNYDGFKIDVWALGVILYTMICGIMPFDEDDETRTKWKIINEDPDFDDNIMSADCKDLLMKLLSKDPLKRPSVKEILLHNFLQPYGALILEKTDKIISKQREGSNNFSTKLEKKLLKRLKRIGYDTQAIRHSVLKKKCDSLSGLWFLLLAKEKKHEKRSYPRRNRSVLSVKRVLESSLSGGDTVNSHDENIFKTSLEVTKVASIGKIITKTADTGMSITQQLSGRKLSEPTINLEKKLTSTRERSISSTLITKSTKENDTLLKRTNIFRKMSDFFKIKKYDTNTRSINGHVSTGSHATHRLDESSSVKNSMDSTRYKKSSNTKINKVSSNLGPNSTNVTIYNKQQNDHSLDRIYIREPEVKKFKSTISSSISRHSSDNNNNNHSKSNSNYHDVDSDILTSSPSFNNKKSSLIKLPSRPLSSISQLSNETYTSDYSTDGTTSIFQRTGTESSKGLLYSNPATNGISLYSLSNSINGQSADKISSTEKTQTRFIRRNLSARSETSSTSERSSKTDSFYDITTTSVPIMADMRSTYRVSSTKDSVLPRFGLTQQPWSIQRSYNASRRNVFQRRGRTRKSVFLKGNSHDTESIIKEEEYVSSSGGDETTPGIVSTLSPSPYSREDHNNISPKMSNTFGEKTEICSDENNEDDSNNESLEENNISARHKDSKTAESVNNITDKSYTESKNTVPHINLSKNSNFTNHIPPNMLPSDTEWSDSSIVDSKYFIHHQSGDEASGNAHEDNDSVHAADLEDNFSEEDFDVSKD